jgi:hypothetical protein
MVNYFAQAPQNPFHHVTWPVLHDELLVYKLPSWEHVAV